LAVVATVVAFALLAAGARPAGKVYEVEFAYTGASDTEPDVRAFREQLRELGWAEGRNVVIRYRFGEGRYERYSDFAAELVRLNVDVIVA
jgi:putative ABC transport system substrate-binding protein